MAFPSRILGALQNELSKQISFSFSITGHRNRPGSAILREGDECRVVVSACNHSGIPLVAVRGTLEPTAYAEFPLTPFEITEFPADREIPIATLDVRIVRSPRTGILVDQIGGVSVSATIDLTGFRFHESEMPLVHARRVEGSEFAMDAAQFRARSLSAGPSLPLSPARPPAIRGH